MIAVTKAGGRDLQVEPLKPTSYRRFISVRSNPSET
jgi:hypothetical protein